MKVKDLTNQDPKFAREFKHFAALMDWSPAEVKKMKEELVEEYIQRLLKLSMEELEALKAELGQLSKVRQ